MEQKILDLYVNPCQKGTKIFKKWWWNFWLRECRFFSIADLLDQRPGPRRESRAKTKVRQHHMMALVKERDQKDANSTLQSANKSDFRVQICSHDHKNDIRCSDELQKPKKQRYMYDRNVSNDTLLILQVIEYSINIFNWLTVHVIFKKIRRAELYNVIRSKSCVIWLSISRNFLDKFNVNI